MKSFGFKSPADTVPEVPTPVGELCAECGNQIQSGDVGVMLPYLPIDPPGEEFDVPFHRDCLIGTTWQSPNVEGKPTNVVIKEKGNA